MKFSQIRSQTKEKRRLDEARQKAAAKAQKRAGRHGLPRKAGFRRRGQ